LTAEGHSISILSDFAATIIIGRWFGLLFAGAEFMPLEWQREDAGAGTNYPANCNKLETRRSVKQDRPNHK
jgi:hypothetical protein